MANCETCQHYATDSWPPLRIAQTKGRFCYWSCDTTRDGPAILATMVASARRAGVTEDFHVFSHKDVPGAVTHRPVKFDLKYHIFKWRMLRDELASLDYDYFVWLDSDNFFTRHPGDFGPRLLRGNSWWCQMESELTSPAIRRSEWWGAPIPSLVKMFRDHGATHNQVWNTNGGMWIVRKDAIAEFTSHAFAFHERCLALGWSDTHDETPLAWLGQVLVSPTRGVSDPERNTNAETSDVWACDWMGRYTDRLPDGKPWQGEDYLTGVSREVNPAIVHAMRSKSAMARAKGFANEVQVQVTPATSSAAVSSPGAGTMLKQMFTRMGFEADSVIDNETAVAIVNGVPITGCSGCEQLMLRMDSEGLSWCEDNVELIVGQIERNASMRKVPIVGSLNRLPLFRATATQMVRLAIRQARQSEIASLVDLPTHKEAS